MPEEFSPSLLGEFLRAHGDTILARWRDAVRSRPASSGLSPEALIDHVPDLLTAIADMSEEFVTDHRARLPAESAERHALARLEEGLDLGQVVIELAVLRECILEVWDEKRVPGAARPEVRFLNRSVDRAMTASVERYMRARDRTLQALDRISAAALEARRLDDFLGRLLDVMAETTASVNTAVILLREGDQLVVRAAVGLDDELLRGARVTIGQGFAGRVAAEGRPRLLSADQIEAEIASSPLRPSRGLQCLYGVPLKSEDGLIGVAYIGSLTAPEFSQQDRRLFQAMATRAAIGIVQHLLQEAAERRAAELAAVLESLPDAVYLGDGARVRAANRAALDLLGVDSVDELNRPMDGREAFLKARPPDEAAPRAWHDRPFTRALRGESGKMEIAVRHAKSGRDIILSCAFAPVRSGDGIAGAVAVCSDTTDRRLAEEERERLYREAQQAVADRQHVLALVSHELRNPLNTISVSAALLAEDKVSDDQRERATVSIQRASKRMARLISDLVDVSSIQAGRLTLDRTPQDPVSIAEEAFDAFSPEADRRGVELRKQIDRPSPPIRADRDRLLQALSNLTSNALNVTSEGSVTIRLTTGDGEVTFGVLDTGPGIPDEVRFRLFEPYWRGPESSYKGSGLGLAIVRGIVEAHGGRVWVESRPGEGAAFCFTVPTA